MASRGREFELTIKVSGAIAFQIGSRQLRRSQPSDKSIRRGGAANRSRGPTSVVTLLMARLVGSAVLRLSRYATVAWRSMRSRSGHEQPSRAFLRSSARRGPPARGTARKGSMARPAGRNRGAEPMLISAKLWGWRIPNLRRAALVRRDHATARPTYSRARIRRGSKIPGKSILVVGTVLFVVGLTSHHIHSAGLAAHHSHAALSIIPFAHPSCPYPCPRGPSYPFRRPCMPLPMVPIGPIPR